MLVYNVLDLILEEAMTLEAKNLNEQISNLKEYEVILHKNIEEVDSEGWFLKHKKTGARIVLLANDDDNKVFNIGFRTPVNNDTGVPHIIEHTVLCGSKKYPVKDPFMELVKGSLNTFLNAMTYPDKTIYPVASYNDKDFKNLMETYMDAVFNPNIYDEKKIFLQEGWHYELENKDGELTYNGVVYNEMKGVYSSVDGVMDRATLHSLYPDTSYSYESGGNPDNIPELSYEEYLDFHRKYYHPSNSYIYLYGDMDMVERLQWIDKEYLGKYDMLKIDSEVKKQPAFSQLNEEKVAYAITDSESLEDNTVLTVNYVIGDSSDVELNTAIQVLEYVLMEMPGAFLKQALIDAKIGKDVYSQYEDDICQPMYSIVAKYANESDKEKFITIINETLEKLAKEGLDKKALLAGLNSLEFKVRESDFGRIPKGLIFGINMLSSWLYDDSNPFVLLETNKVFDVHLMINNPQRYIDGFIDAGADIITLHYEAEKHLDRAIQYIKSKGVKAAVALNPATPVCVLKNIIANLDMVLIMSVNPGFGGQSFIPYSLDKIKEVKEMAIKAGNENILIQVDGGIGKDNVKDVIEAGANVIVAGSAIFNGGDIEENIKSLRG
jgi:ribulose-phosphate 3-epimerase